VSGYAGLAANDLTRQLECKEESFDVAMWTIIPGEEGMYIAGKLGDEANVRMYFSPAAPGWGGRIG